VRRLSLCEDEATNLSGDVRNHTAGGVFARGKEQNAYARGPTYFRAHRKGIARLS
jgi:hypothetical protein